MNQNSDKKIICSASIKNKKTLITVQHFAEKIYNALSSPDGSGYPKYTVTAGTVRNPWQNSFVIRRVIMIEPNEANSLFYGELIVSHKIGLIIIKTHLQRRIWFYRNLLTNPSRNLGATFIPF